MKRFAFSVFGIAVIGFFAWSLFFSGNAPVGDKRNPAAAPGYCIALRGNGEAEPAHWGALARSVEQLGMPSAMAGGSSATVSMFLMEAIAAHPLIQGQSVEVQKERASLMLKSMVGFFAEIQKTDSWNEFKRLYGLATSLKEGDILNKALGQIQARQFQQALNVLEKGVQLGLLDPASLAPITVSLQKKDAKRAEFYVRELIDTSKVFGHFKATGPGSENIFFRAGVVSFEQAAASFGKIAGFYALASQNQTQQKNWQEFFSTCQGGSVGKSWLEIAQGKPACAAIFAKLFKAEFANGGTQNYEENFIGQQFAVYPSTSILTGTAVTEFREAQLDYNRKLSPQFGASFKITNSDDIRFGYWGNPEALQRIEDGLDMNDEKSRRFVPLGTATWRQVLALSPAEPGLSPLKEFTTDTGKEFVSAGGWSDLHPVLVLKSAGCQNVLYITRRGGESLFAQGVAKRLFNFDRSWDLLNSDDASVAKMNDQGDTKDQTSLWSYLYNLGNPHSSFNQALGAAGAVMCTNWNDYPVQSKFMELVEDSYRASYWKNSRVDSGFFSSLVPQFQDKKPGCSL